MPPRKPTTKTVKVLSSFEDEVKIFAKHRGNPDLKPGEQREPEIAYGPAPEGYIKIMAYNVASLRSACSKHGLRGYIAKECPDICLLQEIKIHDSKQDEILPTLAEDGIFVPGYTAHWNLSKEPTISALKSYSGVCFLVRDEIPWTLEDVSMVSGHERSDLHGRLIHLKFKEAHVIGVYVQNAGDGLKTLYERLDYEATIRSMLTKLKEDGRPVIYCGDMNVAPQAIDLKNPKQNERSAGYTIEERTAFKELLACGFVDSFRFLNPDEVMYTWWSQRSATARTSNAGWRIDHFVIDKEHTSQIVNVFCRSTVRCSDHCPIVLIWKNK